MKIYLVKHEYDGHTDYDYYFYEKYEIYSTLEKAEKAFYNHICDCYTGQYSLIEKTLDTQEEVLLEDSPWASYEEEDYEEYSYSKPANKNNAFGNVDIAYLKLYNEYHSSELQAPPSKDIWEIIELEKLKTSLRNTLADSYAKEFCEEYNQCQGDVLAISLLLAKYQKEYESLGYSNAWNLYLKELKII